MRDRSNEYWIPDPTYAGETVFCLAGGPSLRDFDCDRLRNRHVIAVNSSCHVAPWAEVLFFTDNSWFEKHREIVLNWRGVVVTVSRAAKKELPEIAKRVHSEIRGDFPPVGAEIMRQGRSSGHTAVCLAVAMGAKKIVLLGYDMRIVDGRSHHHDDYACREPAVYANEFVPGFDGWNADALKRGVEIVNATPGSALTEFPMVNIDDVLCDRS